MAAVMILDVCVDSKWECSTCQGNGKPVDNEQSERSLAAQNCDAINPSPQLHSGPRERSHKLGQGSFVWRHPGSRRIRIPNQEIGSPENRPPVRLSGGWLSVLKRLAKRDPNRWMEREASQEQQSPRERGQQTSTVSLLIIQSKQAWTVPSGPHLTTSEGSYSTSPHAGALGSKTSHEAMQDRYNLSNDQNSWPKPKCYPDIGMLQYSLVRARRCLCCRYASSTERLINRLIRCIHPAQVNMDLLKMDN